MDNKNKTDQSSKPSPQEEEVDLGNLFIVIGKGIKNFFTFIGNILKSVFHYFILVLIFLRKHTLKLGLSLLIGFIIGFILHKMEPRSYVSNLIIETNYGSGIQLYKQIDYLNNLVKKKDTSSLSEILKISKEDASGLKKFDVYTYQPDKNRYLAYDEYMQMTDTVYTRGYTYEDFKKRIKDVDLRFHEIKVISSHKDKFINLTTGIIDLIENNYFKDKKKVEKGEILQKLSILNKDLVQIDSLRKLYKIVSLKEAERPTGTPTIEISKKEFNKDENDIKLFAITQELLEQINETNQYFLRKNNVLNIISDFDLVGVPDKNLTHKKYFQFAVLFFGLMLGWILFGQLDKYLKNYKN